MKCVIFENLLTITKAKFLTLFIRGNPKTKSIKMLIQEHLGISKGI